MTTTTETLDPTTLLYASADAARAALHIFQVILDFVLGKVLNPLILGIFVFLFLYSWIFFLGVIIKGVAVQVWLDRARIFAHLTGRMAAADADAHGKDVDSNGNVAGVKTE